MAPAHFYNTLLVYTLLPLLASIILIGTYFVLHKRTDRRSVFLRNKLFEVFLAMALHGAGQNTEAMKLLLTTIADTTEDPGLTTYQRAIRFHASKL